VPFEHTRMQSGPLVNGVWASPCRVSLSCPPDEKPRPAIRAGRVSESLTLGAVVRHSHENTRGGATNPLGANQPGKVLMDAAVFGLRSVLKF
jgi:hypothetical protein